MLAKNSSKNLKVSKRFLAPNLIPLKSADSEMQLGVQQFGCLKDLFVAESSNLNDISCLVLMFQACFALQNLPEEAYSSFVQHGTVPRGKESESET